MAIFENLEIFMQQYHTLLGGFTSPQGGTSIYYLCWNIHSTHLNLLLVTTLLTAIRQVLGNTQRWYEGNCLAGPRINSIGGRVLDQLPIVDPKQGSLADSRRWHSHRITSTPHKTPAQVSPPKTLFPFHTISTSKFKYHWGFALKFQKIAENFTRLITKTTST